MRVVARIWRRLEWAWHLRVWPWEIPWQTVRFVVPPWWPHTPTDIEITERMKRRILETKW